MMNISVIGTGYVGLVSGACLAEKGHHVTCVDIDSDKVKLINDGKSPIHEKGLTELLQKNIGSTFQATTDLKNAVINSDISIIAVGTPFDGDYIDLTYIRQVSKDIGRVLAEKDQYHVVVVKSTVVPGTTDQVVLPILEQESGKTAGVEFGVGMNPEFLREGEAVSDFMDPDRIVIGGIDDQTRIIMQEVYSVFDGVDIVSTNNKTAEMIKYTANSLLATLISFSNEIGNLCASVGNVDVVEVMKGVHKDKRFSPILANGDRVEPGFLSYLAAGCGFGGSCFPKDVKALIAHGKSAGNSMSVLDAVIRTNEKQPERVISLLHKHFEDLKDKRIAVLGLAFKPGTDDMRESPAIPIVNYLIDSGSIIKAYDPVARHEAEKLFGTQKISYFDNLEEAISQADAILLLTGWKEFEGLPKLINGNITDPLFIDGRRMLSKDQFQNYEGIGLSK
jgi:UDPglucose 6-dehydrogenase